MEDSLHLGQAPLLNSVAARASSRSMAALPSALDRAATFVLRYGLVLIITWIGLFKFTPTEAMAVKGLFGHSPLFSWIYNVLSVRTVSNLTGSVEIVIAILIGLRAVSSRLSYVGSVGAILMFATTLSFLFTTPGAFKVVDGLWVPSDTGSFLIKDLILFGAALYTAAEARWARDHKPGQG